jgi:hypothetical protein
MHVPRQCFIAIHFLDYNWYLNTTGKSIRQGLGITRRGNLLVAFEGGVWFKTKILCSIFGWDLFNDTWHTIQQIRCTLSFSVTILSEQD